MSIKIQVAQTVILCNMCLGDHMNGGCCTSWGEGDDKINICHECYTKVRSRTSESLLVLEDFDGLMATPEQIAAVIQEANQTLCEVADSLTN